MNDEAINHASPHPRISVIVPAYNCRDFVGEAIASALAQTLPPHEIIVIDDGSTDGTGECAAAFGAPVRVLRTRNGGVAAARNAGLAAATGELIAFLDADDGWSPDKLETQVAVLRRHPEIALLGTETFGWPASANASPRATRAAATPLRAVDRDRLAVRNYLVTSSVLLRREVADRVGEFDTALQGPEDHDYWLRIAEQGSIAVIAAPLTGYRVVPGSLSRRARTMEEGMRRILAKLDGRDFWRGRRLLRRRAYGYVSCSAAQLYASAGDQCTALRRLIASVAWYPLPFAAGEAPVTLLRPRRAAVAILRLLGLKRHDSGCSTLSP